MHIFELDSTTADSDTLRTTTQAYLIAAGATFTMRAIEIAQVESVLRLSQLVAAVALAPPASVSLVSFLDTLPGGYKGVAATLLEGRVQADAALNRKAALDLYQTFELFLGDALAVLFYAFPRFLTTAPENVVLPAIHYDDLFGSTSVLETRLAVARRKVSQLMQSENVFDLIKKTEQRFTVSISGFSDTDRKALLEFSARRNLWIHNGGVVNDIYTRLLRRYSVSPEVSEGQSAPLDEAYVKHVRGLTMSAATAFSLGLKDNVPHIQQYHAKL